MKAKDFEFNNKRLSEFGLVLCQFGGSKGLETVTDGAPINFTTVPSMRGTKHNLTSSQYEDCLETAFQVCKHSCTDGIQEITPTEHRKITAWLCRPRFLKLKLLDESNVDLYHEAKISVSRIELDGKLMGLELNVTTNRPFALKEPRNIVINCIEGQEVYGWERYNYGTESEVIKVGYATSTDSNAYPSGVHTDGYQYISIGQVYKASLNDISHEEGYIYPKIEITVKKDGNLKIHNSIENRETYIANCKAGEVITLDYPVIQSSDSSHNIQNDFNWKFFRIANTYDNSRNDLVISLPCSIKIKYSPIVKVGL